MASDRRIFAVMFGPENSNVDKRGKMEVIGMKRDLRKAVVDGTLQHGDQVGEFIFKYNIESRTELQMYPIAKPVYGKKRKTAIAQALGENPGVAVPPVQS